MKRIALAALLAIACHGHTPTEPLAARESAAIAAEDFVLTPETIILLPGQTTTATLSARSGIVYPLGVGIAADDPSTAKATGGIPAGKSSGPVTITAFRAGTTTVTAVVYNFGHAPGLHGVDGRVGVVDTLRRRAAAHGSRAAPKSRSASW